MTHERFDHVGFTVSDLDRSVDWYTRFLGHGPNAQEKGWNASYTGMMLGYPGCVIDWAYFDLPGGGKLELIQYIDPAPKRVDMETWNVGNGHISIIVDDLHAEFERLRDVAELRSTAPVRVSQGPNSGAWGAYLRDPDGISIQLMQPPTSS